MKNKLQSLKAYYKLHPKRFWVIGIIVILVLILVATHKPKSIVTIVPVVRGDLKSTVLATGQVTSSTDLGLSFSAGGIVTTLPVSVGSKVWKGQVLATLDNGSEYAALKSAQANYQKVLSGSSSEEVAVAQASLASAETELSSVQKVQETLVDNAHRALLSADLTPTLTSGTSSTAPTVTGTYTGSAEGSYIITVHPATGTGYFTYSGLESGTGEISATAPRALGTKGLFIQFSSTGVSDGTTWTVMLPNTKSVLYLSAYNTYQNALNNKDSALASAQAAVNERQANLNLKKAAARPADLDIANAQVLSAQAAYEKTVIRAPASGTVAHVSTKIGERADAQKEVIVVQDVGNLYVEANINETSIAKVALGQPVTMTLDAFGPDVSFIGSVIHIDPSSTTDDGVVNYVIKSSITDPSGKFVVRPGMNANMSIIAGEHPGVVSVPRAAVTVKDGVSTVNVVTDEKKEKTEVRTVTTGFLGDGNLIEITSGLSEGEKITISNK